MACLKGSHGEMKAGYRQGGKQDLGYPLLGYFGAWPKARMVNSNQKIGVLVTSRGAYLRGA